MVILGGFEWGYFYTYKVMLSKSELFVYVVWFRYALIRFSLQTCSKRLVPEGMFFYLVSTPPTKNMLHRRIPFNTMMDNIMIKSDWPVSSHRIPKRQLQQVGTTSRWTGMKFIICSRTGYEVSVGLQQ